jgi:cephalosporin-C deacetylase-like acetyl esterase
MMKDYLTGLVDRQFAARDSLLSTLRSAEDWDRRAGTIHDSMVSWTGPFPERNPLNARITGRLEREDYTVEKILFESRPDFLVSANLYLPKNVSFPRPAVLNVIGHSPTGKARDKVQSRSILQARKGFVALTIDCLGQGERRPPDYEHLGPAPGHTHGIIGRQAFLCGTHIFNIMVWDAIRAVDYLVSRPEVDSKRICVTGCSGGGMMSTYMLPFEPRIEVAVPACNPNTWSHRVLADLGTDAEQVFFGAFRAGIDPRGDPLFAQVPKPLMINATTDDGLNPPRGVWELATWLYKAYSAHGVPEKFTTTMVRAPHGYNLEQREFAYAWMLRWTGGDAADFWEGDDPIEKDEDLWATANGNVYKEPDSRLPQELVLDYLGANRPGWGPVTTKADLEFHKTGMAGSIKSVLHTELDRIEVKGSLSEPRIKGDIMIRPFVLEPEPGIILPGIMVESEGKAAGKATGRVSDKATMKATDKGVVLYIGENGKAGLLSGREAMTELLNEGYSICAVDLRGTGETAPDLSGKFWDFLAGRPIFGQRVRDVLAVTDWLKGPEVRATDIKLWGSGMGALHGAFAGALDEDISGFLLEEPLISFESMVRVKVPAYDNDILLPGILQKFDMPQVYQCISPRPVTLLNPLSGDKSNAGKDEIDRLGKPVSATYRALGQRGDWSIQTPSGEQRQQVIGRALMDK